MFKCQQCGTQVPRGVSERKLVTRKRPRVYSQVWVRARNTPEAKDSHTWRDLPRARSGGKVRGKPRYLEILVPQHTGWEIAEEQRVCAHCAPSLTR
jgi:hypothetical protein